MEVKKNEVFYRTDVKRDSDILRKTHLIFFSDVKNIPDEIEM